VPAAQNDTENCHYITRFVTEPWETASRRRPTQKRYLRYFDFDTGSFDEAPSRVLFAKDKLNSQEVETWLNKIIETPLGARRQRVINGDGSALDDWRFYRAATLMLWLQGLRAKTLANADSRQQLLELTRKSISDTDALVLAFKEEFELALVSVDITEGRFAPLVVPSKGLFPVVGTKSIAINANAGRAATFGHTNKRVCPFTMAKNSPRPRRGFHQVASQAL
jgi:hypothetical protein